MKTLNTRYSLLHSHPCSTRVHVVVAIPYTTHDGEGWAKAYLQPEQACELAESLTEDAALVRGTDAKGSPRSRPTAPNNQVDLGTFKDVVLVANFDAARSTGVSFYGIGAHDIHVDLDAEARDEAHKRFYGFVEHSKKKGK